MAMPVELASGTAQMPAQEPSSVEIRAPGVESFDLRTLAPGRDRDHDGNGPHCRACGAVTIRLERSHLDSRSLSASQRESVQLMNANAEPGAWGPRRTPAPATLMRAGFHAGEALDAWVRYVRARDLLALLVDDASRFSRSCREWALGEEQADRFAGRLGEAKTLFDELGCPSQHSETSAREDAARALVDLAEAACLVIAEWDLHHASGEALAEDIERLRERITSRTMRAALAAAEPLATKE